MFFAGGLLRQKAIFALVLAALSFALLGGATRVFATNPPGQCDPSEDGDGKQSSTGIWYV